MNKKNLFKSFAILSACISLCACKPASESEKPVVTSSMQSYVQLQNAFIAQNNRLGTPEEIGLHIKETKGYTISPFFENKTHVMNYILNEDVPGCPKGMTWSIRTKQIAKDVAAYKCVIPEPYSKISACTDFIQEFSEICPPTPIVKSIDISEANTFLKNVISYWEYVSPDDYRGMQRAEMIPFEKAVRNTTKKAVKKGNAYHSDNFIYTEKKHWSPRNNGVWTLENRVGSGECSEGSVWTITLKNNNKNASWSDAMDEPCSTSGPDVTITVTQPSNKDCPKITPASKKLRANQYCT